MWHELIKAIEHYNEVHPQDTIVDLDNITISNNTFTDVGNLSINFTDNGTIFFDQSTNELKAKIDGKETVLANGKDGWQTSKDFTKSNRTI